MTNIVAVAPFAGGLNYPAWRPGLTLTRGRDGAIYGTISRPSENDYGSIFRLESNGVMNTLFTFHFFIGPSANRFPTGALVQDDEGNLYGTSLNYLFFPSDNGKIFKLTTNNLYTVLFEFHGTNGSYPHTLLLGHDGNLYGSSLGGRERTADPFSGHGTVFRLTSGGAFTTLVAFDGTNGSRPAASLIQDNDGNLYGATDGGGAFGRGTLFKMTTNGLLTTLHVFDGTNGASPNGVMLGRDGNLYGTTARGGTDFDSTNSTATGNGTVFALTPQGVFTTLVFLGGGSRAQPGGLIETSDGELCGTTRGGAVFHGLVPLATLPRPAFIGVDHQGALVRYTFSTFPGGAYQVESTPSLSMPGWTIRGSAITVTGSVTNFGDDGTGVAERYFRVRLLP